MDSNVPAPKQEIANDNPRYRPDIGDKLTKVARDIFKNYSGIPEDQIETHLHTVRDKAWSVYHYPCIGLWSFLDFYLHRLPIYNELLPRMRQTGTRILDVGAGLGQELRSLRIDGVPATNLFATDIVDGFWPLSYELFRDKTPEQMELAEFRKGSLFEMRGEKATPLKEWQNTMDIVIAGYLLHLFDRPTQTEAACCLSELTKPGGWVIGWQLGGPGVEWWPKGRKSDDNGDDKKREKAGGSRFAHNEETFKEMWFEVGKLTNTTWEVVEFVVGDAFVKDDSHPLFPKDTRWQSFACRKVDG